MKRISSRDNPQYRRLLELVSAPKHRRESSLLVLDGLHLIQAYVDAFGSRQIELFVRESAADDPEILALTQSREGRTTQLSDRLFDAASPVETPTGVVAVAPIPRELSSQHREGLTVWIDGIQDPGNLGSVLRSAAAAGAVQAWVSSGSADPWSPKCLRGGMGAQFRLPLREQLDLKAAALDYGGRLVAADSRAAQSLYDADLSGPVAFAIGAEGRGLSGELLALAHARVRIPMEPGIDSLNVAAAAAVLFYEWRRRNRHV